MATNIADTRDALEVKARTRKKPGLAAALAAVVVIIAIVAVLSLLIFGLMYVISYGPTRAPAATTESVSPVAPSDTTTPRSGNP